MPILKGTEVSLSYACFFYFISSSINVSIFHSTWLGTFWMTSYILGGEALNFFFSNSHQIFQTLSNKKNPHFQNFRNFLVHSSQHLLSAQHLMWMMEQLCSMELRELEEVPVIESKGGCEPIIFSYYPFNACKLCSDILTFITDNDHFYLLYESV